MWTGPWKNRHQHRRQATPDLHPAPKGKPGCRTRTADIALVVNDLKAQGKTWKEIVAACKSRFPGRVTSVEQNSDDLAAALRR
jgi:hypothetical protein